MVTTTRLMTAEELAALPTDEPWELWEGVLQEVPGSAPEASQLAHWIGFLITAFIRRHDLGMVLGADGTFIFRRDPDVVVIPDYSFTKWENVPGRAAPKRRYFEGRPDLAVEVTSPDDRPVAIQKKLLRYRNARVPLLWWVYPDTRTVEVYRFGELARVATDTDILDGEDILPGFRLPVAHIFS